jgi:thiol-disulfide isomerase/thioredoxin
VVLALVAAACSGGAAPTLPAIEEISQPMPALSGVTLSGDRLDATDYAGRVTVVNFWATTCAPCVREMPVLAAIHDDGPGGTFVVGVNYREGAGVAGEFVEDLAVHYPSVRDRDGSLAHRFGVPFLPTTFVIDASGRMRYRVTGELDAETLQRFLEDARTA